MERDIKDFETLTAKLKQHSPFTGGKGLRSIITGLNAETNINVQELFNVGRNTVKNMEGQSVFSYSYKRENKVKTLASGRVIKVTRDETIDPALLFQRFLVLSQSGDLCVDDVLQYELSPYPPSLFEAKCVLRKEDKAQFMDAMRNHAVASETAVL